MSDYIPEEILVQVLTHLPVESLVRFRCVCKWWKQLIDSPSFVLDHIALQKTRYLVLNIACLEHTFFLLDPQTLPLVQTLPYLSEKPNFTLVGILHGIVCFYEYRRMPRGVYLWNPSMRKLLKVPAHEFLHYDRDQHGRSTNNAPSYSPYNYSAFWIDPFTKHFKVAFVKEVLHFYDAEYEKYGAIYSSIEGDWKEISLSELKCIANYSFVIGSSLVLRKVAYWLAFYFTRGEDGHRTPMDAVISFDFEQERFDSIEGPSLTFDPHDGYPLLCHWQGSLSLVYLDQEMGCHFYTRQEGSWVNLFSISLTSNITQVYSFLKETEENSKIFLVETTDYELAVFDTRVGCVTLKNGDDDPDFGCYSTTRDFVESLVFP